MNRLIMDGYAVVLENDPMLTSDDSYCLNDHAVALADAQAYNCRCCFDLQSLGKELAQTSMDCGCDCDCCQSTERQLTQYYIDEKNAKTVAESLVKEHKGLKDKELSTYINQQFPELWDHFDVNSQGLVEIERMSQFYKMLLHDMTIEL